MLEHAAARQCIASFQCLLEHWLLVLEKDVNYSFICSHNALSEFGSGLGFATEYNLSAKPSITFSDLFNLFVEVLPVDVLARLLFLPQTISSCDGSFSPKIHGLLLILYS